MKILFCGAGNITRELLKRLGERWEVTLIDKSAQEIEKAAGLFSKMVLTREGDVSSRLVLKEAGLTDQDYLICLTDSDEVNLEAAGLAKEAGVKQVLSLVHANEYQGRFEDLEVQTIPAGATVAREIHHYLENPKMRVTQLSWGRGAIMEIEAVELPHIIGRRAKGIKASQWQLVGLVREEEVILPNRGIYIEAGDRLLILGSPDVFKVVCDNLDCGVPGFPQAYGAKMMIIAWPGREKEYQALMEEALYWAQNSRIQETVLVHQGEQDGVKPLSQDWPIASPLSHAELSRIRPGSLKVACEQDNIGLVIMNKLEIGFFDNLAKATYMNLAESLGRPLLLAGNTRPYKKILVPFNGRPNSELALRVAADIAHQFDCRISLAVVEEPEFLSGDDGDKWLEGVDRKAKELAHQMKMDFETVISRGNPVREIAALTDSFDLLVVGGSSRGNRLLNPNVGEHLAQRAICSVLLVTD